MTAPVRTALACDGLFAPACKPRFRAVSRRQYPERPACNGSLRYIHQIESGQYGEVLFARASARTSVKVLEALKR